MCKLRINYCTHAELLHESHNSLLQTSFIFGAKIGCHTFYGGPKNWTSKCQDQDADAFTGKKRGLSLFFGSLDSVLKISEGDFQNLSKDDLVDIKERLTDAASTLAMLVADMSSTEVGEAAGLDVNLRNRLVGLKKDVLAIVDIIKLYL